MKAIELFTQAIEVDDTCFAYFHNRSLALFLTEKYPAALEDAIKCLELNPAYVNGYLRKAVALIELDRSQVKSASRKHINTYKHHSLFHFAFPILKGILS